MTKEQLMILEASLNDEVDRRTKLGGYSMEADGLLNLNEMLSVVVGHLIETYPKPKKKAKKK